MNIFMHTNEAPEQLLLFINHHNLQRTDGVIAFEAQVTVTSNNSTETFPSEIQVITLPEEKVLYVLAPYTAPGMGEMYRTLYHSFTMQPDYTLHITSPGTASSLIIAPVL
jgi:hypothetical protein